MAPDPAEYDSARVVGFRDPATGDYIDVAGGGRVPTDTELANSDLIRAAVEDTEGETHYVTTSHLTPDQTLSDVLDDMNRDAHYGEFV